jgi:predicted Zn-dependent peptidase
VAENYATEEIMLSFVGNIPFERVKQAAERYFSDIPAKSRKRKRVQPTAMKAQRKVENRKSYQKHGMLIGEAYALPDQKRLQLYLLNNILGGPGMNSRLNMALRERRGYSYSAESHYTPYTDTGTLMIYFSCDTERFNKSLQVAKTEVKKLRTQLISDKRLIHARKQLIGQLAISRENYEHLMLTTAKSYLVFNQIDSLEVIREKLDAISAHHLRDTAHEVLDPSRLNLLIFE